MEFSNGQIWTVCNMFDHRSFTATATIRKMRGLLIVKFLLIVATNLLVRKSSMALALELTGNQFQFNFNIPTLPINETQLNSSPRQEQWTLSNCQNGLLTFELATGFIYKPSSAETLAMMPSTLQLTDCLSYCLHNSSCLAINFEMGLCVLLSSSAKQNPHNLYTSQFPVFTIYAEKKCLLSGK